MKAVFIIMSEVQNLQNMVDAKTFPSIPLVKISKLNVNHTCKPAGNK